MIEVIHAEGRRDALPYVELCEAETQPLKVVDGLLEYVAEDVHVNDRADFGALVRAGHFARGLVTVIAGVLEMGADLDRRVEGV
jgi:hypothetical protein